MVIFRKKDDYYITFLKYARERIREEKPIIDYSDAFNHVHSKHPEVGDQTFKLT